MTDGREEGGGCFSHTTEQHVEVRNGNQRLRKWARNEQIVGSEKGVLRGGERGYRLREASEGEALQEKEGRHGE